ncbi:MAG: hypothetical protein IH808_11390, partial [Proteobacteria bacterium]|nr:hypothetical protein [Pseudomonadota bacterium]
MNTINPRNAQELVNELHSDYGKTINAFSANHSKGLFKFTELVCNCYKTFEFFNKDKSPSQRAIDVGGYVFLAIDNVYVSVKLLVLGYFAPSGNSMRQSLESVCMAILLSHNGNINIGTDKKPKEVDFFKLYSTGDKKALPHKSLGYVDVNKNALGVSEKAIAAFFVRKDHYNEYSHPNKLSLASRMVGVDGGSFIDGDEYDEDKKTAYEKELRDRIKYVSIIPPSETLPVSNPSEKLPDEVWLELRSQLIDGGHSSQGILGGLEPRFSSDAINIGSPIFPTDNRTLRRIFFEE